MPVDAANSSRYRLVGLALAISAGLHAAVLVGLPARIAHLEEPQAAAYSATLVAATPAPAVEPAPAASPARPAPRPRPRARPKPPPPALAVAPVAELAALAPEPVRGWESWPRLAEAYVPPTPEPSPPEPEVVALAAPAAPVAAPEAGRFPVAALPAKVAVSYRITSAFADGSATYEWEREGDSYRITGEAQAEGFFALFLEGQITQESHGTVTPSGLRPERFSERRPNHGPEGLEFDWAARQVTFERGGNRSTSELRDNTVDWLSMIFQLAHVPPSAESIQMQVFTQRKMYRFSLEVLGMEEIDIPMGRVRALHLRHDDPADDREAIDVWLGVEQHHLPVKLRFPVARNRLMVEQVATGVSAR